MKYPTKQTPWELPAVIDPPRKCIQIMIPDDPIHIRTLWGQLRELSLWERWQKEPTKSATLVAQVWADVIYGIDWSNMSCCPEPTNVRYLADGTQEVSYDGGITWTVDHSLDDRFSGAIAPPLEGEDGEEKRCIAATSAQEFIKANLIDSLSEGQTYAELTAGAVAIIAVLGVTGIGLLIGAAVAAIFLAGVTAVQAAFTSEVWTDFRCILYCAMEGDGSFTEPGWEQVKAEILSNFTGTVSAILYNWANAAGLVGLTNAARSHFAAAGDCSDCDCDIACGSPPVITAGTVISEYVEDGRKVLRVQSVTNPAAGGFEEVSIGIYGEGEGTYPCCHIYAWTTFTGVAPSVYGWTGCPGDLHDPGNPETHDVAHAYWSNGVGHATETFVINIVFGF